MLRRPPLRRVCLVLVIAVVTGLTNLFADGSHARTAGNTRYKAALPLVATCSPQCVENFDSVVRPALPPLWTTTISTPLPGSDLPWRTVNTEFSSFPNSAFASDPAHITDNRLISPTFTMVLSPASLTFRRRNNLETNFDGMVLEVSVDGGPFLDIIEAGGSFTSGSYNGTIIGSGPIAGRFAWTGDSGGFVTTSVNLPPSATARSFTFRWRVATDDSVPGSGAFIDNVTLTQPPPNDHFRNAQTIVGASGVINGTNVNATKELPLERDHAGNAGGSSVWYRWAAPASGRFVFITYNSSFDTLLAVYTGDSLPGTPVASNDNDDRVIGSPCAPGKSRVKFDATAGVVYHIAVDRHSSDTTGAIELRWGRSANIGGRITNAGGGSIGDIVTTNPLFGGDYCRHNEGSPTNFLYTDIPTGGRYSLFFSIPGAFFVQWDTSKSISPLTGTVLDYNFYKISPVGNILGTVTMPSNDTSGLTVRCVSTPTPLFSREAFFLGGGSYQCQNMPSDANYVVTPTKQSFIFTPASREARIGFTSPIQNVTGVDFLGIAPRMISGRVTLANSTTGVSGVSVALSGSQTASTVTNANGNYVLTGVTVGGNYTVTPSKTAYTFSPASLSFNNLSMDQTADFTATSLLYLLLEESGTVVNQVAALDSMILLRDPLQVLNGANLLNPGPDRNTRAVIFVANFEPVPGEPPSAVVINLIGSDNQTYDIPAEDVRQVPNFEFTQIIFRLPDHLSPGTCTVTVRAHGQVSNSGTLRIGP